jgi:hypothetical protein
MAVMHFLKLLLFVQILRISLTALTNELIGINSQLRGTSIFDQYLKFEGTGQTENMTKFYGQASSCETKYIQNGQTVEVYKCMQTITATLQLDHPETLLSQWNRSVDEKAYKLPVCSYLIEKIEGQELDVESESDDLYVIIQLRVIQYNCSVEHPKLRGGSSIEVVSNGPILDYCDVTDRFDGTYIIDCRLQQLHRAHEVASTQTQRRRLHESHLQLSTNITAYMDYEHFDAFTVQAALYHPQYPLLRQPITIDQEFCHKLHHHQIQAAAQLRNTTSAAVDSDSGAAELGARRNPLDLSSTILKVDPTRASAGFWMKAAHKSAVANLSATASLTEIMAEKAKHYEWRWLYDIPSMIANTNMSCLEGKNVWLVGESHMRINWEYLTYSNFERARDSILQLLRHHGDTSYEMFQFKRTAFSQMMAAKLDDACDKALLYKAHSIVVIQPGSWDASYWPPQMFIKYPKSAASIIEGNRLTVSFANSFINIEYYIG